MQKLKRLSVVLFLGWHAAVGCSQRSNVTAAKPAEPETAKVQETSPAAEENRDADVLAAVFEDLLARGDSPVGVRKEPPKELRVSPGAAHYPRTAEQVLMRHDKAQWDALTPEQLNTAKQAADAIVRRLANRDPLPTLPTLDGRVAVEAETVVATRPATRLPPFDRPFHAYAPGFSDDGRLAVIALSIPWSIHHADATYILVRDGAGDRWRIVLRQFVYYV